MRRFVRNRLIRQRGSMLVYATVGMVAFSAFVTLGVDVSRVRMVKIQLQGASDAAARAAAAYLPGASSTAQNAAVAVGAQNIADGSSVVVDPNNDITFGIWSNGTFTPVSQPLWPIANAVQVTCVRTASRGNAVPAMFGKLIGITSGNVTAQSIAVASTTSSGGFVGFGSINVQNNTFFGGYNSSVTKSPTEASATMNVNVGSNTVISGGANDQIYGSAVLGPSANVSGFTVSGSIQQQAQSIATPTMPAWNPQTNPGNIPANYTVSSNTTLPGGTYWFTSLNIDANLTFSGPTVVYVNGAVTLDGTLAPASLIPGDLTIYQYGTTTFGDSSANGITIYATVYAPNSDFSAKNNLTFYGSGTFNSITAKNNANFFFDQSLGSMNGSAKIQTVK